MCVCLSSNYSVVKKDTISDSNNSRINEGITYPSVKKPKVVILSDADVVNVYIISKQ